ncbi:MAG: D-2-hydroxyacid dehydrogenase [Saprospiraceae bacterium]|jgi:D-3-phosphoglycerate dehydrogenase|nr:D-2-hydroxyacid dehydrogenase [Saprospiraceae bacterium]
MVKILVNDGIHPDGQLLLEEANYIVDTDKVPQNDLPKVLPQYDVIIVRSATKVRKELIDLCPNLKVIARGGVGLDNIDVEYAKSKGITVINTPAASSQAVAELAMGHIFTLTRNLHHLNRRMPTEGLENFKTLKSSYAKGFQIKGKTLGILGFGRIGQSLAKMAIGLGMNVLAVDPFIENATICLSPYGYDKINFCIKVNTVSFDDMLKKSDFISIHVPGDQSVIGKAEIAKMKQGVFLINTSRGGSINEDDLLEGLNSGKVAGAALDVFSNEPTPRKDLLSHPNISFSSHIGAETLEAQANIGLELADKIIAFYGDDL